MSVVVKITGQVLGLATGDEIAPYSRLTVVVNAINAQGGQQLDTLTQSPTIIGALAIGQNVSFYMATAPADVTAIEAAVSITSIDSLT